jgi:CRISPR/Cas system-associated exonuclease Cas4 (RecB family)
MITSASYSRLLDFESCNFKAFLKHVKRIPDPRPSPAADRGTSIHQDCENWMRDKQSHMPKEAAKHFEAELNSLKEFYKEGKASLEGEWAFNHNWEPTDWKTGWFRLKADAVIYPSSTTAIVIDYKTGKRFGNELKHGEQLQLYSLAVLLREPAIKHVTAELWYFDQDDLASLSISRKEGLRYLRLFDNRARKMTEATTFPPNPNSFSCRYCPYKPKELGGTGHCTKGV